MQSPPSSQLKPIRTAAPNINRSKPQIAQPATSASAVSPTVTQFPLSLRRLEPAKPFEVINDDPVFEVREAAAILGLSKELLDKWRERGQGPDYIQYGGPGGPVRYKYSVLEAYKAAHTVHPSRQPRSRGESQ
jgi:hypothetical protein